MNNETKLNTQNNVLGLDKRIFIDIISGSTSGAITRFFVAPLDVVKIRLQLQKTPKGTIITPVYRGILQSLTKITKEEGVRALWKGNLSAEFLWITYGCIQFTTYHMSIRALNTKEGESPTHLTAMLAGGAAGVLSTVLSYPFDIARTLLIQSHHNESLLKTLKRLATPPIGVFRGLTPALLQIVPQMSLQFMFYESLKSIASTAALDQHSGALFVCGASAGMLSKLIVLPFDVVKKRIQVAHHHPISSTTNNTVNIKSYAINLYKTEGLSAFFKGASPSLIKAGLASALSFLFYEKTKVFIKSSFKEKDQ